MTLGPKGRNVVLEKMAGAPVITNDGVSIAQEIHLSDPFENMGAHLVREVASQTSDVVGDGTTTATVLAQAMVREGMRRIAEGANPQLLRRGIDDAAARVIDELGRMATPVTSKDELAYVASIAANNDPRIGSVIADALDAVGREGVIDAAKVTRSALQNAVSIAALLPTTEALVAEELVAQPGAILAPGFGDLAEGLPRPSSPAGSPAP